MVAVYRGILAFGVSGLLSLVFTGCATAPVPWPQPGGNLPVRQELSVPFFPQKAFQCGPASLAMVLAWSGVSVDPDRLSQEVFTPSEKGSLQWAMISGARRHGRVAYPIQGRRDLVEALAAGHPVVVLQNLGLSWVPRWHYAVVIGFDLREGIVILHTGDRSARPVPLGVFENTWARSDHWGLLVLDPALVPVTASEDAFLSAVLGLEKAGQWEAAVNGYRAALGRWPESYGALMGLGNSLYAWEMKDEAEEVFRRATRRFPAKGSAFNNLAQVLWERGKKEEALTAARKAVELGGPLVEDYRRTLLQIESAVPVKPGEGWLIDSGQL